MRVLVDADGCPVVKIVVRLCANAGVPCLLFCDTAHEFNKTEAQVVICDKGADSVDVALANAVKSGDIVITQDYGVATMCLARNARVLHQDGWEYTKDNIDALLTFRHEAYRQRAASGRFKGPGKRNTAQNKAFEKALWCILNAQTSVQGYTQGGSAENVTGTPEEGCVKEIL